MVASRQVDMNDCVLTITFSNIDSVGCAIVSAYPTGQGIHNIGRTAVHNIELGPADGRIAVNTYRVPLQGILTNINPRASSEC